MNSTGRTYGYTFATQAAFAIVDVSYIVFERDRFERAFLHTLTATDTSIGAGFAGGSSFVFVYAANENTA